MIITAAGYRTTDRRKREEEKKSAFEVERGIRLSNEIHMARGESAGGKPRLYHIRTTNRRTVGLAAVARSWLVAARANQRTYVAFHQSRSCDKNRTSRVSAPRNRCS